MIARILAITALALAAFVALGGGGATVQDADQVFENGLQRMESLVDEDAHGMISNSLQDSTDAGNDFAANFDFVR